MREPITFRGAEVHHVRLALDDALTHDPSRDEVDREVLERERQDWDESEAAASNRNRVFRTRRLINRLTEEQAAREAMPVNGVGRPEAELTVDEDEARTILGSVRGVALRRDRQRLEVIRAYDERPGTSGTVETARTNDELLHPQWPERLGRRILHDLGEEQPEENWY
jgi:hypothetical protein